LGLVGLSPVPFQRLPIDFQWLGRRCKNRRGSVHERFGLRALTALDQRADFLDEFADLREVSPFRLPLANVALHLLDLVMQRVHTGRLGAGMVRSCCVGQARFE
jgi:hypothetical protein